jgi:alpha-amylase/alpha-mannosidase (GH57 family)
MTDPVTLLFGVHAHQPAGNFPEVIDHAHERCYGPFLRTMADYPAFRFTVHFSGPLLDDLAAVAPRVASASVVAFLGRLVRAAELLEANANPELLVDVLVVAWPAAHLPPAAAPPPGGPAAGGGVG